MKDPGHFPENRSGVFDETKDRHRNDDIEVFVQKRQAPRRRHPKIDVDPFPRRPSSGRRDHRLGGVDPDDTRAALREFDRKIAIAAPDIQNISLANVAEQVKDQPPFEALGNGA